MAKAFLIKYFPPSKTMKLWADITTFSQFEQEFLYEAWERFKDLLRRCPHHELQLGLVIQTFYYCLLTPNRTMIDAAACGNLLRKTAEEGYELKLDGLNMGGTNMRLQEIICEKSGGEHYVKDCQDSGPFFAPEGAPVNQVGVQNCPRNDPYSNTYNLGWRQPPNFSWGGQSSQNRPQGGQPCGKKPMYRSDPPREEKSNLEQMMSKFISSTETRLQNQDASIKYAKFLKDILANKRKLEDHVTVNLTENYSALVQNKIPPKLKDPRSFSIPCMIGDVVFQKALCDLGASINLMRLSVFRKLGLGEHKPTRMSLQLADRSVKYPRGVIEDVQVKVGKFIFPADFVVLDMEEDMEMPLILGRPFLATGKALIDVQKGKLKLRVGKKEITFNVFKALKHILHSDSCYRIDAFDSLVSNCVQDALRDPLEATLTTELREDELDAEKAKIVAYLNDNQQCKRPIRMRFEDLRDRRDLIPQKSSLEEPPTLELKPLPPHLKYVYLAHKSAFAWKVVDIKEINPLVCMHKILMEEMYSPHCATSEKIESKDARGSKSRNYQTPSCRI
ncbi:uncharacterized protein LOC142523870 [Primulina tabacum]|uniref:uncharacterized protein LOC142523870 n=1 Tax=Primulina tabacum TaxID=48773 RepID=UPI003F5A8EE1